MTLSEWFHLTHGYDLSSVGGDELADALRADGWRIVKLEDHGTKWDQDLKVVEELS